MITQSRLKEVLFYDPETGDWFWIVDRRGRGGRAKAGTKAGAISNKGYLIIGIDGKRYSGHRLAFLYMTGNWPKDNIDHEDLDRADNRWDKIREASFAENRVNSGPSRNNKLGVKGVRSRSNGKFLAEITINRKSKYLGTFDNIDDAASAYIKAAKEQYGEFARNTNV